LIIEMHSTHTYIGKGVGFVYTPIKGDPCPLQKKPKGKAGRWPYCTPQNPEAQPGLWPYTQAF
jgi:hypothetical protein